MKGVAVVIEDSFWLVEKLEETEQKDLEKMGHYFRKSIQEIRIDNLNNR